MKTLWNNELNSPRFPILEGEKRTDVLIIGGGIAGILTAYFLSQKGVKYILVEKGEICSGTTSGTTAKITAQHGLVYDKLRKQGGLETAQAYLLSNLAALEKFAELCKDIDCDFERKNNYVYSVDDRKKLEKELDTLNELNFKAELVEKLPLPLETAGAVMFPNQAQFHPLKFLYLLAKTLNIYENTFVREMIGCTALTDNGRIVAHKVIVATHFPFINKHGAYFVKLYQHRSYMLALENAQSLNGMYVDESNKGLTFRNYKDYLILGGGAHRTGKQGGNYNELRSFVHAKYPHATEKFAWAAQDCMSLDKMPYIGQYSKSTPQMFVATGFNKWGMTGSMLSAMLLSDLVTDTENEYAQVFNPSRSILKPQLFLNGAETTANLVTISKKRCPHLGCALKWNNAEHSWDCACHGSRFSEDGTVLDNPANGNLE